MSMNNSSHINSSINASTISVSISSTISLPCASPASLQYQDDAIPLWGFNSTCDWVAVAYADLTLSGMGVLYNAVIFLIPLFFRRLRDMIQGGFVASYAAGCFLCSVYFVYFGVRILVIHDVKHFTMSELAMHYILMLFLAYHLILHMYVLCWDQYRSLFRCNSHLRYVTTCRLLKIGCIIWFGAIVMATIEAVFVSDLSDFPKTKDVSQFRMVCTVLLLFFFWFLPFLFIICWNGDIFCFLLKVTHNGYDIVEQEVADYKPEVMPELAPNPWYYREMCEDGRKFKDYTYDDDDEDELPTIPNDVRFELTRSFLHLVVLTCFGASLFVWFAYHILAMMRTGEYLSKTWKLEFYYSIYNCHIFVCLYFMAKFLALLNPLCYFYCRPEICKMVSCAVPWSASENLASD